MIYLNDVAPADGGATVFLKPMKPNVVLESIHPTAGMVLCFSHDIYHAGDMFNGAAKYLMRSDVMYRRRKEQPPSDVPPTSPSHLAIARQKVKEAEDLEAVGDAAKAAQLYRQAYKLAPELERHD